MPSTGDSYVLGPGLLFVVSGPSGAGKDTLVDALRARMPRLRYSVSATTREPRPGEREGEHYFFLTREEFERRLAAGGFLEWREYNGNLYGTPRDFVERTLTEGYDLIMKPEVNGALAIKKTFPDAVLIFLLPDRFSHLRARLLARRTETNEEIARRLEIAHQEVKSIRDFDYIVINEERRSEDAVRDLQSILQAERFRIHRFSDDSIRNLEES
ncbi:MAG: guanylate kinase [Vulcanimicrobiaceae bacterium]